MLGGATRAEYISPVSQCQCREIESVFDRALAEKELAKARRRGPRPTTRFLVEALRARGVKGKTLLDIGGGVGTIQHELLAAGVREAVDVDASTAYIRAARKEARRLGFEERITFHSGNFVDLAPGVPVADIVTLDRVVCCYDDAQGLVSSSATKARSLYGVVYPRDTWWGILGVWVLNFYRRIRGDNFRVFNHPTRLMESILAEHGLSRTFHRVTFFWQVAVFQREAT
jgi:hypothetical protein